MSFYAKLLVLLFFSLGISAISIVCGDEIDKSRSEIFLGYPNNPDGKQCLFQDAVTEVPYSVSARVYVERKSSFNLRLQRNLNQGGSVLGEYYLQHPYYRGSCFYRDEYCDSMTFSCWATYYPGGKTLRPSTLVFSRNLIINGYSRQVYFPDEDIGGSMAPWYSRGDAPTVDFSRPASISGNFCGMVSSTDNNGDWGVRCSIPQLELIPTVAGISLSPPAQTWYADDELITFTITAPECSSCVGDYKLRFYDSDGVKLGDSPASTNVPRTGSGVIQLRLMDLYTAWGVLGVRIAQVEAIGPTGCKSAKAGMTVNQLPYFNAPATLTPENPSTSNTLTCTATAKDPNDNLNARIEYAFDLDNAGFSAPSSSNTFNCAGKCNVGSKVTCKAIAYDNQLSNRFSQYEVSRIVGNRIPTVNALISPSNPKPTDTLTCTTTANDPDGGTINTIEYSFSKNFGTFTTPSLTNTFNCAANNCKNNDVIECYAKAYDAQWPFAFGTSNFASTKVKNNPPVISNPTLTPQNPVKGDLLTCTATANDPDGGTPSVEYSFARNAETYSTWTSTNTFNCQSCVLWDSVKCKARAIDAQEANVYAYSSEAVVRFSNVPDFIVEAIEVLPQHLVSGGKMNVTIKNNGNRTSTTSFFDLLISDSSHTYYNEPTSISPLATGASQKVEVNIPALEYCTDTSNPSTCVAGTPGSYTAWAIANQFKPQRLIAEEFPNTNNNRIVPLNVIGSNTWTCAITGPTSVNEGTTGDYDVACRFGASSANCPLMSWSTTRGTIDSSGIWTSVAGPTTITASSMGSPFSCTTAVQGNPTPTPTPPITCAITGPNSLALSSSGAYSVSCLQSSSTTPCPLMTWTATSGSLAPTSGNTVAFTASSSASTLTAQATGTTCQKTVSGTLIPSPSITPSVSIPGPSGSFVRTDCPSGIVVGKSAEVVATSLMSSSPSCVSNVDARLDSGVVLPVQSLGCTNGVARFNVTGLSPGRVTFTARNAAITNSCQFTVAKFEQVQAPELDWLIVLLFAASAAIVYSRKK